MITATQRTMITATVHRATGADSVIIMFTDGDNQCVCACLKEGLDPRNIPDLLRQAADQFDATACEIGRTA